MIDRLGMLWHYARARDRFAARLERVELDAWQEQEVRRHLRRVGAGSRYFQERLKDYGLEHWREWPVSGKRDMMSNFERWNTAGVRLEEAMVVAEEAERTRDFSRTLRGLTVGLSSGTTGSRGIFLASPAERRLWAGMLLARVLQGTLLQEHRAALFLRADSPLYQTVGSRRFHFSFFDLYTPLENHLARLRELRPTVLAAPPSVLRRIAESTEATSLLSPPGILLSVADVLDERDRDRIEAGFGCVPGQIYQATEGFLAATCPQGRLHWNEDVVVVQKEWLDVERTRYTPVLTDFRRLTQPIVRYRLDDVILRDNAPPCLCGSSFETLGGIEGRCDDVLRLPRSEGEGEVTIFPDFVRRAIVLGVPAGIDYGVVQTSPDIWEISLSGACGLEGVQSRVEELCRDLGARVPTLVRVDWVRPAGAHKRRRVRRNFT